MGLHDAIAWTPKMEALIGTAPDAKVAARLGLREDRVRYRRRKLSLPPYRQSKAPVTVKCSNCGRPVEKKARDVTRSARLFCNHLCSSEGQRRRDSDMLRYGPGWKNRRAEIRKRDKRCKGCGKSVKQNGGKAFHIHHLVPFRYNGTNDPTNLAGVCEVCHHHIEAVTNEVLRKIQLEVRLDKSILTIRLGSEVLWRGSVRGADSPTLSGSKDLKASARR